ncbi:TIM barrel protein [Roseovarius aestuarii]|nr:TIM barrel protein [Roseovarius aestuarii]
MSRLLSAVHLTAIDLAPPAFIAAAKEAGFDAVGLRLRPVVHTAPFYPLMDDPAQMRETLATLKDTGIIVHDIEFVRVEPDLDVAGLAPLLDAGAELGARELVVAPYDKDPARLADTLGRMADLADTRGIGISIEFFPWAEVTNLAGALALAEQAGPRVGVLADSLHFDRTDSTLEDLRSAAPERLRFAHLCDAPVNPPYHPDDLLHISRSERMPPGEGQIDLQAFLDALPEGIPLGIEVPMATRAAKTGSAETMKHVFEVTRRFLDTLKQTTPAI